VTLLESATLKTPLAQTGVIYKVPGDTRSGILDWVHIGDAGYLIHLTTTTAASGAGVAAMGIGNSGSISGLNVANYATGQGIALDSKSTASGAAAIGFSGQQNSTTAAPLMYLVHNAPNASAGPLLQITTLDGVAGQAQQIWTTSVAGVPAEFGRVKANDGTFQWNRAVVLGSTLTVAGLTQLGAMRINSDGTGLEVRNAASTATKVYSTAVGDLYIGADGASTDSRYLLSAGRARFGYENGYVVLDDNATSKPLRFRSGGQIAINIGTSTIGFLGASAIARRATTADATDLATVITLANALKADLVAYGLKS
jgi:hypothetical protein